MAVIKDLTGQTFDQWTVIGPFRRENGITWWRCRCSCGKEMDVRGGNLTGGKSTRCLECGNAEARKKLSRIFHRYVGIKEDT